MPTHTVQTSQLIIFNHLQVLVHVSTTYCNCVVGTDIGEQFYPPPTDWREAIAVAEKFDSAQLASLTSIYLGDYPNTYTFTKALGEHVIKDMCEGRIPTLVLRPSIVISTIKDPVAGWIDNFNGPVGLLVACGKGKTLHFALIFLPNKQNNTQELS